MSVCSEGMCLSQTVRFVYLVFTEGRRHGSGYVKLIWMPFATIWLFRRLGSQICVSQNDCPHTHKRPSWCNSKTKCSAIMNAIVVLYIICICWLLRCPHLNFNNRKCQDNDSQWWAENTVSILFAMALPSGHHCMFHMITHRFFFIRFIWPYLWSNTAMLVRLCYMYFLQNSLCQPMLG